MRIKLTSRNILTLTPKKGVSSTTYTDLDCPGFRLVIRESGTRVLVFGYYDGRHDRKITIGIVGACNFADVRKNAEKLYAKVKLGANPAVERAEKRAKERHLFAVLAKEHLDEEKERLREKTLTDKTRHLLVYAKPLHSLAIEQITRADISTMINVTRKDVGATTSNRLRASLSRFFAWAVERGRVEANPCAGGKRAKEKARDRKLEPAELKLVWHSLPDNQFGAIMKLLALTGARANEIAALSRSEIDGTEIKLPGERTKNGEAHTIPLSPMAQQIIAAQPKRDGRDLIFGNGIGPFSGWSKSKTELDAAITMNNGGVPMAPWRVHDLRRTCASGMQKLGVRTEVIERALNHVSGSFRGVAGIYQRDPMTDETRAALNRWAAHVAAIVEGRDDNVVSLRVGA